MNALTRRSFVFIALLASIVRAAEPADRHLLYVVTPGIRNLLQFGGAGILVFLIFFRLFFKDIAGFIHCIGFSVGGGKKSPSGGPGPASGWSRLKLLLGAVVPAGSGYAAYVFLPRFFPAVFQ